MSPAADHLKDEVHRALDLLSSLTKASSPQAPLGELNPKSIQHCKVFPYLIGVPSNKSQSMPLRNPCPRIAQLLTSCVV